MSQEYNSIPDYSFTHTGFLLKILSIGEISLVLRGRNKPSISTAQWLAFVSPFERLRHCTIKVFYKV